MDTDERQSVEVSVRNVGGIDESAVALEPGVTALTGRNATNRTSFLRALMGGLGSDRVSLKSDADEGEVTLQIGDETYTRTLTRAGGAVSLGGDPYLDDATEADLFAFLLEANPARRAVSRDDDLRDLVMRPIDTDAIESEIARLENEKRRIDEEIAKRDELERELPDLEARQTTLEEEIDDLREKLAAKNEEIEGTDLDVEETQAEKAELEERLDELQSVRSQLVTVRSRLETERESLEALYEEEDEVSEELAALREPKEAAELESEIDHLRQRKQALDTEITELQSVIQFNDEMLADRNTGIVAAVGSDGGAVTDQLLEENVVCWTCGTEVAKDQIEQTLSHLQEHRQSKLEDRQALTADLDELKSERSEREQLKRRREQLESKLAEIEAEIETRSGQVDDLEAERESLEADVTELETEVESLKDSSYSDILELHQEANQLEFEIGRKEREREQVQEKIRTIQSQLDERESLEEERNGVQDELTDQRTRIDQIEADAVESFNEHMAALLAVLDYENIDRIWLERTESDAPRGRGASSARTFDLHVVRSSESGAAYEDTIDHLSESEREVTGLVFGLAGYLVHEVYETLPFMVLDSLEAIDSGRISTLVEYFAEYAPYLVVALLPEDAAGLADDHHRVTDI